MRNRNDLDDVEVNRKCDHVERLVVCSAYVVGAYGGREVLCHEDTVGGVELHYRGCAGGVECILVFF